MTKDLLCKVIEQALAESSGKPVQEQARNVVDRIYWAKELEEQLRQGRGDADVAGSSSTRARPKPPSLPESRSIMRSEEQSHVVENAKVTEREPEVSPVKLNTITATPTRRADEVENALTLQQLEAYLMAACPQVIAWDVEVDGKAHRIELRRNLIHMPTAEAQGIRIVYNFAGASAESDLEVSEPVMCSQVNEENVAEVVTASMEKIKRDAMALYRPRPKKMPHPPVKPGSLSFNQSDWLGVDV